ncbi:hypothetical protein ODJ79_29585 [Actinoplanes sp. KI2]|uniref:hypothetical protein n=1 Tax=Actinoplanes sp. KI2 TaxID=2983315 RepID=UPI0021D5D94A|nr:hypothetical protein [Actinoplanes sp. KI2]MCU7727890.1 hypothetical protein [Actinoplanes sp. KI2]
MNVFVPPSAVGNQRAPIYFAVNNAGWTASYIRAGITDGASYASSTSNVGAALKAGYVYVDVANRSRGLVGAGGDWPGKAPAAVVDAKAAVRYLRLNDARMPGSAERIVVNGTSGGGALAGGRQPHAGNYDVPEATAWIAKVLRQAGDPLHWPFIGAARSTAVPRPGRRSDRGTTERRPTPPSV